jgi:hypothetical protein
MDGWALQVTANRQLGLFTRQQARECGASAYQVRQRVQRGDWVVVLDGVLAAAGLPLTARVREKAALLAVPGSVLAGPTAARRHGLWCPDPKIFIAGTSRARSRGFVLLREEVPVADVAMIAGWPMTTPSRTVVDCLRLLGDETATQLLRQALSGGLVTKDELAQRMHAYAGRRGALRLVGICRAAGTP